MTDNTITEPVDGEVVDYEWVDTGVLVADVEKDGELFKETYEFVEGEKVTEE